MTFPTRLRQPLLTCLNSPLKSVSSSKQSINASRTVYQAASNGAAPHAHDLTTPSDHSAPSNALSRHPTKSLLRSLLLGFFLTSPILYRPGLALLKRINASQSPLLDPDNNPFLRRLIKPLIYDQFCGGVDTQEVRQTAAGIRRLGFSGVILAYSKEIEPDLCGADADKNLFDDVQLWKKGTMASLHALDKDNWLGIKLTGAGSGVVQALKANAPIPAPLKDVMEEICAIASARGVRVYVDAEKQAVQYTIEKWTVDLMRRWNMSDRAVVYTTLQTYLKDGRQTLERQARIAQDEGWMLGVKIVRGAYMAFEDRSRVHDTKADTDQAFDGMVRDLLDGTVLKDVPPQDAQPVSLLIAGHNPASTRAALSHAQDLHARGALRTVPEFAQIQGMAEDVGHAIIDFGEANIRHGSALAPRVYKLLTWGSVRECMLYLLRRAIENKAAAGRMKEDRVLVLRELRRRFFAFQKRLMG